MKISEGHLRVAASDVANFLASQELTQLDLRAARHMLRPPHPRDLGFEDLVRRGEEHERGVLEGFRADGYEVADLSGAGDPAGATAEAIRGGGRGDLPGHADQRRGMEFLYDRHRLNVATSRARALAIIVASPDLIRVSCRTPHQMTLANALCRAWEERG